MADLRPATVRSASLPGEPGLCRDGVLHESNASLVLRVLNQDVGAFAVFAQRYHEFVFRICFGILRHRQDAEDATQDTFTRVVRYLDRWDSTRPLEPWLATLAGNRSRSQLARRHHHASLSRVAEPQSQAIPAAERSVPLAEEITLAVNALPARQRQAFECFHHQQMGYADIADAMHCPIGTVKTLVHRARQALMQHLRQREIVPEQTKVTSSGDSL